MAMPSLPVGRVGAGFLHVAAYRREPLSGLDRVVAVVDVVNAACLACEEGRRVPLEPVRPTQNGDIVP